MPIELLEVTLLKPDQVLELGAGVVVHLFERVAAARAAGWDNLFGQSPWLQIDWLATFAPTSDGGAGGPDTHYLQFLRSGQVIGQALLQRLPLAGMQFGPRLRPALVSTLLGEEAWQFGQVLFSGTNGFFFLPGIDGLALLGQAREAITLRGNCWLRGQPAGELDASGIWLVKDLPVGQQSVVDDAWWPVAALPELVLDLRQEWRSFDDYLAALPSKYRTRLRRARNKFQGLTTRLLLPEEFQTAAQLPQTTGVLTSSGKVASKPEYASMLVATNLIVEGAAPDLAVQIEHLYAQLVSRAAYVPYRVPPGYIIRLKELGAERVQLRGYFEGVRLVGFSTLLLEKYGSSLAHLAACNPAYNTSHQLYLNMLADLLDGAIEAGAPTLNLGRTATTIKSSLGAQPHEYASFIAHDGCVRHQLLGPLARRTLDDSDSAAIIQQPFESKSVPTSAETDPA